MDDISSSPTNGDILYFVKCRKPAGKVPHSYRLIILPNTAGGGNTAIENILDRRIYPISEAAEKASSISIKGQTRNSLYIGYKPDLIEPSCI